MEYLFLIVILFLLELTYFRVADRYNIIDKPNHRSAHTDITLRGGGIIFWFAALLYCLQNLKESYLFLMGITIVGVVSFWDDIQSLSNKVRLVAQFIAITMLFLSLQLQASCCWWLLIVIYILAVGIINAYNFMDGINGMTGMMTLAVLGALLYVNQFVFNFTNLDFIVYPMVASFVFLFFNFRKKAKCFAGDVGSISIAFWVIYLLLQLMVKSDSVVWLLLLAVYGVETAATIVHRLYLRENIFEAHRWHFYQVLSNGLKIQHRAVAFGYALLQILVAVVVVYGQKHFDIISNYMVVLLPLVLLYSLKFYVLSKIKYQ